jgi:hypothetical protein
MARTTKTQRGAGRRLTPGVDARDVPNPLAGLPSRRLAPLAALAVLVSGCGGGDAPPAQTAGECVATVHAVVLGVAQRVYAQAVHGRNLATSVRRVGRSRALAATVARDDPAAVRAALRPLLRAQIQRIVVTGAHRVLADEGIGPALAPVTGVVRGPGGEPVGRYTLSVGQDAGIAHTIRAVTGAQVVMRGGGRAVATAPGLARRALPRSGTATIAGATYAVSSFAGSAFPAGPLRVWVLSPRGGRAPCASSRAATVAATVGGVGERLLADEQRGAATARVLRAVAADPRVVAAVAHDRPAALRAAIVALFRDPTLHVVRIRATRAGGRLVGDVGGAYVLAPASAAVRSGGRVIGRVTLSIQDDTGYMKLMHRFTGAQVVLRTAAGQVPGSTLAPGPARLPGDGRVTYRGTTYRVVSFTGRAFPSGAVRISLLVGPSLVPFP